MKHFIWGLVLMTSAIGAAANDDFAAREGSARTVWEVRADDIRVDRTLRRWADEAGYTVRWDAERYFLISAPTRFEGDFLSAVEQLLSSAGIRNSTHPLEACVYGNQPPLLRITLLGDNTRDCQ